MLRASLFASFFLIASITYAADPPEIPAEKRKAMIDAMLAKKPKSNEDALKTRLKSLESATIDKKLKAPVFPKDLTAAPSFPSEKSRDDYSKRLVKAIETEQAAARAFADTAAKHAPALKGLEKGEIGYFSHSLAVVGKVIDPKQAMVTISIPNLGGGRNQKVNVLVTGSDTSSLFDGKDYAFSGVYYVVGNTKVNGTTVMQIVPLILTKEERARFGVVELEAEKK